MSERKKNILTLVIAILVSLVALERILRIFEKQNLQLISTVSKEGMTTYKPNLDKYIFDNESLKKVHVKTNSLGFVGENFNEAKVGGALRIAVLGDSFTAATGVDYEKSYSYLLTKKIQGLISTNPSSTYNQVEVLNFGVGGMGTADEMKYYSQYAQKFHPDVVVLSFYLGNDLGDNGSYYNYKDAMLASKEVWDTVPQYGVSLQHSFLVRKDRIYRMSAIIRLVDRVVRSSPQLNSFAIKLGLYRSPVKTEFGLNVPFSIYYYLDPLDAERAQHVKFSSDLLTNFKKQLDKDGVKFAVMFIPDGMTVNSNMLNAFKTNFPKLKDYNFNPPTPEEKLIAGIDPSVKILNLRNTMEQAPENIKLYMGEAGNVGGHLNEDGHKVVADALSDFIFNSFLK